MNQTILMTGTAGLLALSTLAHAAGQDASPGPSLGNTPPESRLEQRMGPDERARMHRELNDDLGKSYPDRDQVESRRQMMHERMRERLRQADENGDGTISRAEADRSMPGIARNFDRIDSNGDGTITREEMKTAREKLREIRQQRQAERQNGNPRPPAGDGRPRNRGGN